MGGLTTRRILLGVASSEEAAPPGAAGTAAPSDVGIAFALKALPPCLSPPILLVLLIVLLCVVFISAYKSVHATAVSMGPRAKKTGLR